MNSTQSSQLWNVNAKVRLVAARQVSQPDQANLHQWVSAGCPVAPWPYGMPTAINPKIIVLGPSPGNSPEGAQGETGTLSSYDPPTFGRAHPKLFYDDSRGFFVKIRQLCSGLLGECDGLNEQDALALSGMMNLDIGQYGKASDVNYDARLVTWVLKTIYEKLKPDYLICLGLKSRINDILPVLASDLDVRRPHTVLDFKGYTRRALRYEEWLVPYKDGGAMRIVMWPQHPSRAPFSNPALWQASIKEYAASLARV